MSNMHNLFKGRVSAARCKKIDRALAAAGVDAEITAAVIPGDGPRGWFTSPNLGFPFDRDNALATRRVLEGAGLWPPAK